MNTLAQVTLAHLAHCRDRAWDTIEDSFDHPEPRRLLDYAASQEARELAALLDARVMEDAAPQPGVATPSKRRP